MEQPELEGLPEIWEWELGGEGGKGEERERSDLLWKSPQSMEVMKPHICCWPAGEPGKPVQAEGLGTRAQIPQEKMNIPALAERVLPTRTGEGLLYSVH